jgi:hypothetical protein
LRLQDSLRLEWQDFHSCDMLAPPAELGAMWQPRKTAMERATARVERRQHKEQDARAAAAADKRLKEGSGESGRQQQQQGVDKVAGQKRGIEQDGVGSDEEGVTDGSVTKR